MPDKPRPAVLQFTLGGLFLAMTWLAIVCIGLNTPTKFWAAFAASLTLLALFTAALAAIYTTAGTRAFAVGFAVFGFGSWLCLHRLDGYAPKLADPHSQLLYEKVQSKDWASMPKRNPPDNAQVLFDRRNQFIEILQSALIVVVALLGGIIARYLEIRRKQTS